MKLLLFCCRVVGTEVGILFGAIKPDFAPLSSMSRGGEKRRCGWSTTPGIYAATSAATRAAKREQRECAGT